MIPRPVVLAAAAGLSALLLTGCNQNQQQNQDQQQNQNQQQQN